MYPCNKNQTGAEKKKSWLEMRLNPPPPNYEDMQKYYEKENIQGRITMKLIKHNSSREDRSTKRNNSKNTG